jgi:4-oxalocrotonate tautomerase family enzyme
MLLKQVPGAFCGQNGSSYRIYGHNLIIIPIIQITTSRGRSAEQKRELVIVLTEETARIMKTEHDKVRILVYDISTENWKCWNFRLRYEIEDEGSRKHQVPL